METLIGLLIILLPVIFKAIGKRLEEAGKEGPAAKMRELSEILEVDDDSPMDDAPAPARKPMAKPSTVTSPAPVPTAAQPESATFKWSPSRSPQPVTVIKEEPILVEEEKKKGEKIDPKKLVIYSEIMKTKF